VTEPAGVTGFTNVDAIQDPNYFVEFLDARTSIEGERAVKELVLSMLALEDGNAVLDVGCGTGDDTREIARLVAPNGSVVGIDFSAAMIAESRKRSGNEGGQIEFVEGDACAMPFPDGLFDRARTDRVFVHLTEPERALAEMVRVLKPGGLVVVTDVDAGTFWVDSPYRDTTRKVFASIADRNGSGWVGRALPRLFQDAGLQDVACTQQTLRFSLAFARKLFGAHLGIPSVAAEFADGLLEAWWDGLVSAEAAGHFNSGQVVFTAVGRKP
jgi:ubiquinone/menaquinone biosynthesis C-methylase UbiE